MRISFPHVTQPVVAPRITINGLIFALLGPLAALAKEEEEPVVEETARRSSKQHFAAVVRLLEFADTFTNVFLKPIGDYKFACFYVLIANNSFVALKYFTIGKRRKKNMVP